VLSYNDLGKTKRVENAMKHGLKPIVLLALLWGTAAGGEKSVLLLRNFCDSELKSAGFEIKEPIQIHIKALGGGGDYGWTYKSNAMFAYGWIINADTRALVWRMEAENTKRKGDDRQFDGTVELEPGSYEVYFTVYAFTHHSTFSHLTVNIDQRKRPLFKPPDEGGKFLNWFKRFWSDDVGKAWEERCARWGIELFADASVAGSIVLFDAPKEPSNLLFSAIKLGDETLVRQGLAVSAPVKVRISAVGESCNDEELCDFGWMVDIRDRHRVWEMTERTTTHAGGADKNVQANETILLPPGKYVVYYVTDRSHSAADWNAEPPYDPYHWGITISTENQKDLQSVKLFPYREIDNVIVSITKAEDNQRLREGFTLNKDTWVRVYAIGERSSSRSQMADFGTVLDAKTRNRVWSMDADRTFHAGGAAKNRMIDEVLTLRKGSYVVTYTTDDSHAYGDWNLDPPFDPENYGITLMGADENFSGAVVGKFTEERDQNIIAQIVRVGDDADLTEKFILPTTTRLRVYAIGEGQNREMYDYGWIEDARTGNAVWEMTYGMTHHAGGGRKNRMLNTTIVLDKGEYTLHFQSDGSHSYSDWNVDPPEDEEFWGITLYRTEGLEAPVVSPGVRPPSIPPLPPPPRKGK
jgi:hypothetical protein